MSGSALLGELTAVPVALLAVAARLGTAGAPARHTAHVAWHRRLAPEGEGAAHPLTRRIPGKVPHRPPRRRAGDPRAGPELAREVGERTTLEARLAAEMAGAAEVAAESRRLEGEVAAAAAANAALAAEAKEVALAKDSLVLLKVKNKMYAKGGSRPGSARGSLKRLSSRQPVVTDEVPRDQD